jgi:hypothetical protein
MPIPISISEMSVTPSLNSPQGTESAKGTIDDYLRAHAAFIRQTSDLVLGATVTLPSASTVAIGFAASSNIAITGTTTINAFDTYAEGALRYVTFSGVMTLVYSAALALPTTANITTVSGDSALFKSLGGGNWKCVIYQRLSGLCLTQASATTNGHLSATDFSAFSAKQAALGFAPVQQGGGVGQGASKVYLGWSGAGLKATVDATDLGYLVFSPSFTSYDFGLNVTAPLFSGSHSGNGSGLTNFTAAQINGALGYTAQAALGFTPYNSANPAGYISSITSGNVTTALGFTPQPALGFTAANAAGQAFTGNISAPVFTATSDERKKTNWRPLTDAQLDTLANMQLAGLFEWRDGSGASLGGSAQEIARIVPEAVHEDEEGNLTVNYGGLCFAIQQATLRRLWGAK